MTDVGDNGGANAPSLVDRDTPGHTIGFSWAATGGLLAGQTSDLLTIDTNASRFTTGTLAVIDSQTSDLTAFEPSAVPEPATWAMMLLGFAGLGVAGYRGSRKSTAFSG
ncbi:MAG TPA: PEPxxWA-CTERM sorting domain-containing protein [Roseiarcus sp.]